MTLAYMIWQRGSARSIMRDARQQFRIDSKDNLPGAHLSLASVHYSLVKRYTGFLLPLAAWHVFRAVSNVDIACIIMNDPKLFSTDQIDIITTIWFKAPWFLGGKINRAKRLVEITLRERTQEMKPHTQALMLITLRHINVAQGDIASAKWIWQKIQGLISRVESEVEPDRDQQLVRILSSQAFFMLDHGLGSDKYFAGKRLQRALDLATAIEAQDQVEKILREWQRRTGF